MVRMRLKVSERLRELLSYDKFAGDVPRLLILQSRYWLDDACRNAAERLGWELAMAPVPQEGVMPREQVADLLQTLGEFRPDFILTVNLGGMDETGLFAGLFEDLQIPYVTWFVDDPRTIIMGRTVYASEYAMALTWDAAYVEYLRAAGFANVHVVPLGVDDTVFDAEPAETWTHSPTFVGNSMVSFAEREWAWMEDYPDLARGLREAFDGGRVTRDAFGAGLSALLDPELVVGLDEEQERHADLLFFVEGTRRLRHALVETLTPEGLQVRGDEEWKRLIPDAGGPLNYAEALPAFYRECEINLNTTSIQMPHAVNQRVFDCPAAGGFLLTDAQSSLADLFDVAREVACYANLEECRELYRYYLARPAQRRAIASAARARVLGEHTYRHRLERIASLLAGHFG
jgi:spore maturation protein CgeB